MFANTSIDTNLVLLLLLIGAFIGMLIVQGILGSLRGIWAPIQQPISGQVGGGNSSGIFYLMIFGLLAVLFLWLLNQKGNPEPTEPIQPVHFKNEEPRTSSIQLNDFETSSEPRFEHQSQYQLERAEPEYDFGDYPIQSVTADKYQEEEPAPECVVIQYLAGKNYDAAIEKIAQLQNKYKKSRIYLADQGDAHPYKVLIGNFASDRDALGFIKMYNLKEYSVRPLSDYQLVEY